MKTSFLDYYKMILEKVSFDRRLLSKEYNKAIQTLQPGEARELDFWLKANGLEGNLEFMPVNSENRKF